jgi:hypothetical protein
MRGPPRTRIDDADGLTDPTSLTSLTLAGLTNACGSDARGQPRGMVALPRFLVTGFKVNGSLTWPPPRRVPFSWVGSIQALLVESPPNAPPRRYFLSIGTRRLLWTTALGRHVIPRSVPALSGWLGPAGGRECRGQH